MASPWYDFTATIMNGDLSNATTYNAEFTAIEAAIDLAYAAYSGTVAITGGTIAGVAITNSTVTLNDTASAFTLALTSTSNTALTANRSLVIDVNNADRTLDIAGNITTAGDLITSGAFSLTLTTTASTSVTLPTTGTLATLAGTETLSGKTLTQPKIASGGYLADANGNELIIFTTTASAVNEVTFANAATGANPTLTASGGDSDVGLDFQVKGAGVYNFKASASGPADLRLFEDSDNGSNYASIIAPASMAANRVLTLPDATDTLVGKATTDTLSNKTLTAPKIANAGFLADANGNELIICTTTASAVNEITLANAATGGNPTITASGGDSDIGLDIQLKGAGKLNIKASASGPAEVRLFEDSDNGSNYGGLIAPASMAANRTWTLPDATDTLVGRDTTDTLTNKTLVAPALGVATATSINFGQTALSYYGEGTWTPSLGGDTTYTTQTGYYTRVGRIVILDFNIQVNTLGTGSATTISGIPFAAGTGQDLSGGSVGYFTTLQHSVVFLTCVPTGSTLIFTDLTAAATGVGLTATVFTNSTNIRASCTYRA